MVADSLIELALRLFEEGKLPRYTASSVIAGFGDGSSCALCGKRQGPDDVVYELHFGGHAEPPIKMHLQCFLARELALGRR